MELRHAWHYHLDIWFIPALPSTIKNYFSLTFTFNTDHNNKRQISCIALHYIFIRMNIIAFRQKVQKKILKFSFQSWNVLHTLSIMKILYVKNFIFFEIQSKFPVTVMKSSLVHLLLCIQKITRGRLYCDDHTSDVTFVF